MHAAECLSAESTVLIGHSSSLEAHLRAEEIACPLRHGDPVHRLGRMRRGIDLRLVEFNSEAGGTYGTDAGLHGLRIIRGDHLREYDRSIGEARGEGLSDAWLGD